MRRVCATAGGLSLSKLPSKLRINRVNRVNRVNRIKPAPTTGLAGFRR
jgi:hypothetical protein